MHTSITFKQITPSPSLWSRSSAGREETAGWVLVLWAKGSRSPAAMCPLQDILQQGQTIAHGAGILFVTRGLASPATLRASGEEKKKKKEEHNNTLLLFHKHARDHFLWITPLTQPGHHYISDQKNCHSGVTPVPAGTASLRAARARSASCLTHWGLLGQRAWAELTAPRCGKGKRWGQNDVKSLKSASFGPTSSHQNISKRQLVTCNGSPRYL